MFDRTLNGNDIEHIREERKEADAQYNDALTLLDHAIAKVSRLPGPPPLPDEEKLPAINESWRVLATPRIEVGSGWRARLASFIWRLVSPVFERQQHFNACLVDHLNRNIGGERRSREALVETLVVLRDHLDALATFESRLLQFLQQITPYVDTKDRDVAAAILSDPHEQLAVLEQSIATIQQQQVALKREVAEVTRLASSHPAPEPPVTRPVADASGAGVTYGAADAYKYVCFESQFRGGEDAIRRRLEGYLEYFRNASDVLDVGCGRGEFLETLRDAGVSARGVDLNPEMVHQCRSHGLDVAEADAITYLSGMSDGSFGGLFAAQLVEHLTAGYLVRFLDLAYAKLRPGSKIVLETINVDCWSAFFGPYLRDITHVHPLPSDTLKFLLQASGFQRLQVIAQSPVAPQSRMSRIPPHVAAAMNGELVALLNANTDRLNNLLFTHMDYAIVGERL